MTRGTVGAVVQLVAYRTRNQEVAGSSHTWSTAGGAFSQLRFRKRGMTSQTRSSAIADKPRDAGL